MGIFDAIGSLIGLGVNADQGSKNRYLQKEFAQKGIQWKVQDAKAAGIHPLYALGAQTHSFTPVGVGDAASTLGDVGQNIDRAINAASTDAERKAKEATAMSILEEDRAMKRRKFQLDMQGQEIQNMILAGELMGMQRQNQNQPPLPDPNGQGAGVFKLIEGQDGSNVKGLENTIKASPAEIVSHNTLTPERTAGTNPMFSEFRRADGSVMTLPSEKFAQATEDMGLLRWMALGDQWIHEMRGGRALGPPRKGYRWVYRYGRGFVEEPYQRR